MQEFQATRIEVVNKNKINAIVGVIYRHARKQNHNEFITYMTKTLKERKNSNKSIYISGDFNYDLLKHETNKHENNFIDTMFTNFLKPHSTTYKDNKKQKTLTGR